MDFRYCGVRHRQRSPDNSKSGAQAYEAVLRRELALNGSLDRLTKIKDMHTLRSFSEKWLKLYVDVNNKPSEQHTKRRVLRADLLPMFGKMPLNKIGTIHVEDFKRRQLAKGLSPKTINNSLTILRKCLVTAVEWGELQDAIPVIKLLKTTPPKFDYLTSGETEQLLSATSDEPWKAMMYLAVRTGMRFSELSALEWIDVNFSKQFLCVRHACVRGITGTPKNGKIRYVPLTADAIEALRRLPQTSNLVFHVDNRQINYSMGRWALEKACKAAGLRVVSWHVLRHSFASQLVAKGAPLKAVQELLGHSTIHMTLRYSHLNQQDLRNAINLLEGITKTPAHFHENEICTGEVMMFTVSK